MRREMITTAAGIATALLQTISHAEVDAKLAEGEAKQHGCLVCHAVDKQKVGPSYQSVSTKYKGKGVADVIGSMKKLPVHEGVLKKTNDPELKLIGEWILTF